MTFFSDKNLYDVYFEGGLPSRAVPLKLSSRGLSANLSTADQNRIFNHIISLLEKVPDEEENIEYVEESLLPGNSFVK